MIKTFQLPSHFKPSDFDIYEVVLLLTSAIKLL